MFYFCVCFYMYYLREKYYKPITVQYYIVNCVSWVPRLALLDLGTNWTYKCALWTELVHMYEDYCIEETHVCKLQSCLICGTLWTTVYQASLPMELFQQECWSGLPFPLPWDLPNPGIEPVSLALQVGSLPLRHQGSPW